MTTPTLPELEAQEASLILPDFDETIACRLGGILVNLAQIRNLPVVINIRNANRTFFHAALPGSSASYAPPRRPFASTVSRSSVFQCHSKSRKPALRSWRSW